MKTLISLTQSFEALAVPLGQREVITALAAARKTAYELPLPAAPVENYHDHYEATLYPQVCASLGQLNEATVLDFDFAEAAAKLFWISRYKLLHQPSNPDVMAAVTQLMELELAAQGTPVDAAVAVESLHALDAGQPYELLSHTFAELWGSAVKGS